MEKFVFGQKLGFLIPFAKNFDCEFIDEIEEIFASEDFAPD